MLPRYFEGTTDRGERKLSHEYRERVKRWSPLSLRAAVSGSLSIDARKTGGYEVTVRYSVEKGQVGESRGAEPLLLLGPRIHLGNAFFTARGWSCNHFELRTLEKSYWHKYLGVSDVPKFQPDSKGVFAIIIMRIWSAKSRILASLINSALLLSSTARAACTYPASCWPSDAAWAKLNQTLHGSLIRAHPVAAPCHEPYYNEVLCTVVTANWTNPYFRASQPGGYIDTGK